MKTQTLLHDKLKAAFNPEVLEIENESHKHSSGLGAESHFKILMVSPAFEGHSRVERQRRVHDVLSDELKQVIHALSLRLLTPGERTQADGFSTPNCQSKK